MSFKAFTVQRPGVAKSGTGLGASLMKGRNGAARLYLFLRTSTADELGWADGDALAVELGEEEHHGLIRLCKDKTGTAAVSMRKATRGGQFIQVGLGVIDLFVDRVETKKWCQFEAFPDGWVEVVLPSWADETNPARRNRLPSSRTLALPPPAPRRTTAAIAGDPPPGRSALDQRPTITRGQARRAAEAREAPGMADAEAAAWNRKAEDDNRLAQFSIAFGLTKTEARYLRAFLDGRLKTKEALLTACHDEAEHIELKSVDVYVHKLRTKLATRLVDVETLRGQGYRMTPDMIARVMVLVDADGPGREDDEAELAAMADDETSDAA